MNEELIYELALRQLHGIGPTSIHQCLMKHKKASTLFAIPFKEWGLPSSPYANKLDEKNKDFCLGLAEEEIELCIKNGWEIIGYSDKRFPSRLKLCTDAPVVLFGKGKLNLNPMRIISVVGTRSATAYGSEACKNLIEELKAYQVTIVSGMALGIDAVAHWTAAKNNIPSIGVLGNSLDYIYPHQNRLLYEEMISNHTLLTEFCHGVKPDRGNFPQRNRVVAGMCDATIVIEAAEKGGALITADLAYSYNRDVFALPGRTTDKYSKGCNLLIKSNKAAMVEGAKDLAYLLGWDPPSKQVSMQLMPELSEREEILVNFLRQTNDKNMDEICEALTLRIPELLMLSTELEIKGLIKTLPGNRLHLI